MTELTEKEKMDVVRELFRSVLRAFYEDREVVIGDYLTQQNYLADSEICGKFRLHEYQVRGSLNILVKHHLIQREDDYDLNDPSSDRKTFYYFINYGHFLNLLNLTLTLMERELSAKATEIFYVCDNNNCGKRYTQEEGLFIPYCELCHSSLHEEETSKNPTSSVSKDNNMKDSTSDENSNLKQIYDALATLKGFKPNPFNIHSIIRKKREEEINKTMGSKPSTQRDRLNKDHDPKRIDIILEDSDSSKSTNSRNENMKDIHQQMPSFLKYSSVENRKNFDTYMKLRNVKFQHDLSEESIDSINIQSLTLDTSNNNNDINKNNAINLKNKYIYNDSEDTLRKKMNIFEQSLLKGLQH